MIKNIVEDNNNITIESIHKQKLTELISKFQDSNNNFDLENFIKFLNDEKVKVIREGYSLNFLGKRAAELQSALDSTTVFVPDKEHNSKPENKDSENIYISADNLEALRHLKKSYHNKIKCIYIDPPYNTGNDGFCYVDKFKYDKDELANKLGIDVTEAERILNMESSKSNSHSAWLSFMYARLLIAQELLMNEGIIFISIDDNEYSNLKLLCDNIFDEKNYVASIINRTKAGGSNDSNDIAIEHEYLLCYKKSNAIIGKIELNEQRMKEYKYEDEKLETHGKYTIKNLHDASLQDSKGLHFNIKCPDGSILNGKDYQWKCNEDTFKKRLEDNRIVFKQKMSGEWIVNYKIYLNEEKGKLVYDDKGNIRKRGQNLSSIQIDDLNGTDDFTNLGFDSKIFKNPKPISMIKKLLQVTLGNNDIFMDFFCGASSSIHALMDYMSKTSIKCKYVAVQLKETPNEFAQKNGYKFIDEIGIERIKRAAKKIKDETNADIDYGFKHYTLVDKKDTLDTLEKFDSHFAILTQDEILGEFSIESRLITFLCDDGFGLNAKYEEIDVDGYKCYLIDGFLYLLDKGFDSSQIAILIEKVDKKEIALRKIVIFGYAFDTRSLQQLKDNADKLGINDNKDIIIKY